MNDSILHPNYSTTSETGYYLEAIDRQRWIIDNLLLMPKHEAWIRRDIHVRRAAGTTRIEGATLDEDAVRSLEGLGPGAKVTGIDSTIPRCACPPSAEQPGSWFPARARW